MFQSKIFQFSVHFEPKISVRDIFPPFLDRCGGGEVFRPSAPLPAKKNPLGGGRCHDFSSPKHRLRKGKIQGPKGSKVKDFPLPSPPPPEKLSPREVFRRGDGTLFGSPGRPKLSSALTCKCPSESRQGWRVKFSGGPVRPPVVPSPPKFSEDPVQPVLPSHLPGPTSLGGGQLDLLPSTRDHPKYWTNTIIAIPLPSKDSQPKTT